MADSITRKYLAAALLLAFAGLSFFAEKFTVLHRLSDLAAKRLESLQGDIERLDKSVDERVRAGDYFRFLGVRPGAHTDQGELNPNNDLVETAVVLDKNFATLARSGRDLDAAERVLVREKRQRNTLSDRGVLRRFDVVDFEKKRVGYLVMVIRPDLHSNLHGLVATNYNFSTITDFSRDRFNGDEKQLIAALITRQTAPREEFTVRGHSYLATRHTWLTENLIIFQISSLPPLYTYLSIYFFLIALVASLVWIIHAHAAARHTRREVSERILASYGRALNDRESAVAESGKLASESSGVAEKLVFSDEPRQAQLDLESRLAAARAAETARAEKISPPIVIDIQPEERHFRFMNPSVTLKPAATARLLDERDQKLRQRAFSEELKGLMAAVSQPAGEQVRPPVPRHDDLMSRIASFQEKYRFPAIDQYLYFLNELYFDEVTGAEVAEAMRVAGDNVQSGSFAILIYDNSLAAYRTGFTHGVPPQLAQTFFLLPRDSVLSNDFADYGYIEITTMLRKNSFFSKRFPAGFTDQLKGIHFFTLTESFLKARIVFFDSDRGGAMHDEATIRTVKSYLRQIAPAIHMYFLEIAEAKGNPKDLADWAVHELKECLSLSEGEPPLISQYVFESSLPLDVHLHMIRDISHLLREGEKILMLSPSRVVAVHMQNSGRAIEEIIARQGKKYIVKESEFGKASRNLYTFIEF